MSAFYKTSTDYHNALDAIEARNRAEQADRAIVEEKIPTAKPATKPATKAQIDVLIKICLDCGCDEAAGLLQLGSDSISNLLRDNGNPVFCSCYEYVGDNRACKIHCEEFMKSDEQERSDIYSTGMGV